MQEELERRAESEPNGLFAGARPSGCQRDLSLKLRRFFIRKQGNDMILLPKPLDWSIYLTEGAVASQAFMDAVEDLPVQEREL